jgi:hypothetical protein
LCPKALHACYAILLQRSKKLRIPPENKGISIIVQFHKEDVAGFSKPLENQQSETGKNAVKHGRTLLSHTELCQVV